MKHFAWRRERSQWSLAFGLDVLFLRASTLYMSSYFRCLERIPEYVFDGFWRLSWCVRGRKIPVDACLMCAWGFRRHISSCGCHQYTFCGLRSAMLCGGRMEWNGLGLYRYLKIMKDMNRDSPLRDSMHENTLPDSHLPSTTFPSCTSIKCWKVIFGDTRS